MSESKKEVCLVGPSGRIMANEKVAAELIEAGTHVRWAPETKKKSSKNSG